MDIAMDCFAKDVGSCLQEQTWRFSGREIPLTAFLSSFTNE